MSSAPGVFFLFLLQDRMDEDALALDVGQVDSCDVVPVPSLHDFGRQSSMDSLPFRVSVSDVRQIVVTLVILYGLPLV